MSVASIVAALAFAYSLFATLALLLVEGFFAGQDNQRTVLVWLMLPIVATFLGWMAVSSPNHYLRVGVWFLVLAVLFFCWLSIFSVGVYYLPAPLLMVISVLGPWDGGQDGRDA
ncbi:MAG TPA: hypothetical protein VG845_04110 [Dehalococcoidia bacterium]|nr:hypothetical protein [Dehalococcoidia bacterium]